MSKSCPYCPRESENEVWGMSPEGMQRLKENHDKEHCFKCPTCGNPIEKQNQAKQ